MRILFCLFSIASISATERRPVVEVYFPPVTGPLRHAMDQARGITSQIYDSVGIHLTWRVLKGDIGCSMERGQIVINVSFRTAASEHPGALAISYPGAGGSCVTIFGDRIEPMAAANPRKTAALLGHVLAHELGHVLQGIARHSDSGVMKARWTQSEIRTMSVEPLLFNDDDAALLRQASWFVKQTALN